MSETVTLPHLRPYRGKPLLAIWAGLIVGSWIAFVLVMKGGLALFHWLDHQPKEFWEVWLAFFIGIAWDRVKIKRGWWKA